MKNIKRMKKIIILAIAISFIFHDVGWASIGNDAGVQSTLAPESFFNIENSVVRTKLLNIITMVEHSKSSPIDPKVMTIEAVWRILKDEAVKPQGMVASGSGYVKIDLSEGYHLYYYVPMKISISNFIQAGYEQVGGITTLNNNLSRILLKDLKYVSRQAIQTQSPDIGKLVNEFNSPSKETKENARRELIIIGEDPDRWQKVLDKLRQWESDNEAGIRRVKEYNLFHSLQDYEVTASIENFNFIWSIINNPSACSIDLVERLIEMKAYNIGRTAYILSGKVSQNVVTLNLPEQPLKQLEDEKWRCNYTTFPKGPQNYFTIEMKTGSAVEKETISNEIVRLAYSVEDDAICVNQFLVNGSYSDHGIGGWLLKWIISDILTADFDNKIKKIRFHYRAINSTDFIRSLVNDGVLTGPYNDDFGEYYLLGEVFERGSVDERINPYMLIGISKGLIASIDPDLPIDKALVKVVDEIDTISAASGCTRLVQYLPIRDEKMMVAAENNDPKVIRWKACHERGIRPSQMKNEPLRGEKRLLEMIALGEIDPIAIPGICEFKDGMWLIHDRQKLIEYLRSNERFSKIESLSKIIAEAKELLDKDLQEPPTGYGPIEGNSVLYAYAADRSKRPLFLFAIVGRLNEAQKGAVTTGFYQSRIAAEKIYELETLRVRAKEIEKVETVLIAAKEVSEGMRALFHALGNLSVGAMGWLHRADPAQAKKGTKIDYLLNVMRRDCVALDEKLTRLDKRLEELSKLEPLKVFEKTVAIPGLGRAVQSTINIYHLLLAADTIDKAKNLYDTHPGENLADSFAIINRYFFEKQRFMSLSDFLNDAEYQETMKSFESMQENIKDIPQNLKRLLRVLSSWREKNKDIFKRVRSICETLESPEQFPGLVAGMRSESGGELSKEEISKMRAVYYIDRLLPVFEQIAPVADSLVNQEVNKESVDLIAVVADGISLGVSQAKQYGLKIPPIEYIHEDPEIMLLTDPGKLNTNTFSDIITNGVKYGRPDGGGITVTVAKGSNGKYARISVRDSGVGISEDDRRSNLFRKEERLKTTKNTIGGTGLGLYSARKVAKRLGGQLILEESVMGEGSTFTIYLPMGESETVWPASQDEIDSFNDRIQQLSRITVDLKDAILKEAELVRQAQASRSLYEQFVHWQELIGLISDLNKAFAVQRRLKEDLDAGDLSSAYLDDAIRRRIGPLLDPIRIKEVIGHVKAYMGETQMAEAADTLNKIDKLLAPGNTDEKVQTLLKSIHDECVISAKTAQPLILISEELFDGVDADHLKGLLGSEGRMRVCDVDTIARISTKKDSSKEKVVCILGRDAYDEKWKPDSAQRNNNRATLLVLEKGALKGPGYLYLEGVTGLALSMAAKDDSSSADRVMWYIKMLFNPPEKRGGGTVSEKELKEYLSKGTFEFFDYIRLNLKPIEPFDIEKLLEKYKLLVETYLTAA